MEGNTATCPLCNHVVSISSNYPHNHRCANAHRLFHNWLTPESGHPVFAHPDDEPTVEEEISNVINDLANRIGTPPIETVLDTLDNDNPGLLSEPVESPTDMDNPDSGTAGSDPIAEADFGGGTGFEGGGGGSEF